MVIRITIDKDALDALESIQSDLIRKLEYNIAESYDDKLLARNGFLPDDGTPFRVIEVIPKDN